MTLYPQCQALKGVERTPYTGDVAAVQNSGKKELGPADGDMNPRPCTRHGGMRDLHESSFSFSGTVVCINHTEDCRCKSLKEMSYLTPKFVNCIKKKKPIFNLYDIFGRIFFCLFCFLLLALAM